MAADEYSSTQPLVRLHDVQPTPEHYEAMRRVEEAGFEHVIMHGGALLSLVLDVPINDFDFTVGCRAMQHRFDAMRARARALRPDPYRIDPRNPDADMRAMLAESLGAHPDTESLNFIRWHRMGTQSYALEFKARCKNVSKPLHIVALSEARGMAEVCAFSDTPVDCIAMNMAGHIYAHPNFMHDAEARLYVPFDGADTNEGMAARTNRFPHLARKIPGLRLVEPQAAAPARAAFQPAGLMAATPAP